MIYNLLGGSSNLLELKSLSSKLANDIIYSTTLGRDKKGLFDGLFNGLLNYLNDNLNTRECVLFSLGSACWSRITGHRSSFLDQHCDNQMLPLLMFEGIIRKNIISGACTTIVIVDNKLNMDNNINYVKNKLAYLLKHYEDEYYFFSLPDIYPDDSSLTIVNTEVYNDSSLLVFQLEAKHIRLVFYTKNLPTLPINPFNIMEYNEKEVDQFYIDLKLYTDRIVYRSGCIIFLNFIKFKSPNLLEKQIDNFIQESLLDITGQNNDIKQDIELIKLKEDEEINNNSCRKLLLSWNGYVDKSSGAYNIQNLMFTPSNKIKKGLSTSKRINDMQIRVVDEPPTLLIPYTGVYPIYGIVTNDILLEYNINKIINSIKFSRNYKIGNITIHVNKDLILEITYTTNLMGEM